jgi:acetolactate synthase-1/2/3 large subunit
MIKWKQVAMNMADYGLDFGNPDFVKYAESYGAHGHRLEREEDLSKMLNSCLNNKGVHLFEVPIDYSENERVLIQELKSLTCNL